jgi:hypothetical protein
MLCKEGWNKMGSLRSQLQPRTPADLSLSPQCMQLACCYGDIFITGPVASGQRPCWRLDTARATTMWIGPQSPRHVHPWVPIHMSASTDCFWLTESWTKVDHETVLTSYNQTLTSGTLINCMLPSSTCKSSWLQKLLLDADCIRSVKYAACSASCLYSLFLFKDQSTNSCPCTHKTVDSKRPGSRRWVVLSLSIF